MSSLRLLNCAGAAERQAIAPNIIASLYDDKYFFVSNRYATRRRHVDFDQ